MRIAIVSDNLPILAETSGSLADDGHAVDQLESVSDWNGYLARERVDLLIMDIDRFGLDVLTRLQQARSGDNAFAILLTTQTLSSDERAVCLNEVVDDVVVLPMTVNELTARCRALLRRTRSRVMEKVIIGNLVFNRNRREILVNNDPVSLTRKEITLAEALLLRRDEVVARHELFSFLYGQGADVEEGTLDIYIHRLRKKLQHANIEIVTHKGVGYQLQPEN